MPCSHTLQLLLSPSLQSSLSTRKSLFSVIRPGVAINGSNRKNAIRETRLLECILPQYRLPRLASSRKLESWD
jgi:hypothetical protein